MKVIVDMKLTPLWVGFLTAHGIDAEHWSSDGRPDATDEVVTGWARANGCVVMTHELDFGDLLAIAGASGPSVILIRAQDVLPEGIGLRVMEALRTAAPEVGRGALVLLDDANARIRVLPVRSRG